MDGEARCRCAGMRVSRWEISTWSFLMASAHGAGLMVIPVLLANPTLALAHTAHVMSNSMQSTPRSLLQLSLGLLLLAVIVHTAAMLLVAGILALTFFAGYEKSGLALLRRVWLNFDVIWAAALLVAAVATLWS
jgi:hypothetical protein